MSFDKDYQEFIEWITDPEKSGSMGPVKYTKEEDAFARLFAAYLNCRYPSALPNHAMHSDGEGRRSIQFFGQRISEAINIVRAYLCRR